MRNGASGIDHVIVGVRDLERARMGWTRLGFTLTPRGRHLGQGTANYCIMFARDYLELLGFVEQDEQAERLAAFLESGEGPMAVAFAPEGPVAGAAAALATLGLHRSAPRALGRQLELPEGTVVPRFSLLTLAPEETPALDCFVCGHLTPELVRRPEWTAHPNGVVGLRSIYLIVADTAALLPAYDRLFGLHEVTTTDAVACVRAGPHRILFATPDDFANASRSHMAESLSALPAAKRTDPGFLVANMIPTCISDDVEAAKAVKRRTLTRYTKLPNYRNYWKEAGYGDEMAAIETAIGAGRQNDIPSLMSDRWLADTTLFGPAAAVRDGIAAWREAGVTTPILVPSSASGNQLKAVEEIFAAFA